MKTNTFPHVECTRSDGMAWHGVTADDLNVVGEEGRRFKKVEVDEKSQKIKKRHKQVRKTCRFQIDLIEIEALNEIQKKTFKYSLSFFLTRICIL